MSGTGVRLKNMNNSGSDSEEERQRDRDRQIQEELELKENDNNNNEGNNSGKEENEKENEDQIDITAELFNRILAKIRKKKVVMDDNKLIKYLQDYYNSNEEIKEVDEVSFLQWFDKLSKPRIILKRKRSLAQVEGDRDNQDNIIPKSIKNKRAKLNDVCKNCVRLCPRVCVFHTFLYIFSYIGSSNYANAFLYIHIQSCLLAFLQKTGKKTRDR